MPRVPAPVLVLGPGGLGAACQALLEATGADRVTVRVDLPDRNLGVDEVAAEAVRGGHASLAGDCSLDQRGLDTVRWLQVHRAPLVQPDFGGVPRPPEALTDRYGVRAQVLAPIEAGTELAGWVSVHSATERHWTTAEVGAAVDTARRVGELLGVVGRPATG